MTVAGVSINPVAFLVVQEGTVKLLPVNHSSAIDRLLDYVPDLFEKINQIMKNKMKGKSESEDKNTPKAKTDENNKKEKNDNNDNNNKDKKDDYTYEFEYNETEEQDD